MSCTIYDFKDFLSLLLSRNVVYRVASRFVDFSYFRSSQRIPKLFDTLPLTAAAVFVRKGFFEGFLFAFENLVTIRRQSYNSNLVLRMQK
jgi:hypothetical protein